MAMKIRTHSHTHTVEQITSQLNNILNIFKYKLNILKYLIFFFFLLKYNTLTGASQVVLVVMQRPVQESASGAGHAVIS